MSLHSHTQYVFHCDRCGHTKAVKGGYQFPEPPEGWSGPLDRIHLCPMCAETWCYECLAWSGSACTCNRCPRCNGSGRDPHRKNFVCCLCKGSGKKPMASKDNRLMTPHEAATKQRKDPANLVRAAIWHINKLLAQADLKKPVRVDLKEELFQSMTPALMDDLFYLCMTRGWDVEAPCGALGSHFFLKEKTPAKELSKEPGSTDQMTPQRSLSLAVETLNKLVLRVRGEYPEANLIVYGTGKVQLHPHPECPGDPVAEAVLRNVVLGGTP